MKTLLTRILMVAVLSVLFIPGHLFAQNPDAANPNASPEARALLKYIQGISGKLILAGQHNYPASGDKNTQFAASYIGKTPVIWSSDFGFSAAGDKDSYLSRPAIVKEAIRQHQKGAIINLCWHAVPPTADEPVTFQPIAGADQNGPLKSVQGRLTEKQFQDILTPGTELYKKWIKQVDEIASFLKQLQDAKVPVLWRPYHEMNGDWFWWGGRFEGKYTTAALYKQIFDRFVKFHKLNNLVWVWSVDRPSRTDREFVKYYPGTKYLDILAIDIYGNDFSQSCYDKLLALSDGKPVTLGEVGNPPSAEILKKQPAWVYWVVWAGMTRGTSQVDYDKLLNYPPVTFLEDQSYIEGTSDYRKACGLQPLRLKSEADFSGEWRLNECEGTVPPTRGMSSSPHKLSVIQKNNQLSVRTFTISEYSDDEIAEQTLTLDGKDNKSITFMNSPRVQNAVWSSAKDTLKIKSKIRVSFEGKTNDIQSEELWYLIKRGNRLIIETTSQGFMNMSPQEFTLVYNKQ